MAYNTLLVDIKNDVLALTLNRPAALNSFTLEMHAELKDVIAKLAKGELAARALLITGAGRGFCAGQDLSDGINLKEGQLPDLGLVVEQCYNPLIKAIRTLPLPVIAAVNGPAAGAGMSLAMACDLIYAARSASFLQAFVNIALVPDAGSSYFLPRLVGPQRAARMALLGEKISAEEAERWGLLTKVMDDDKLMAEATAVAEKLAKGPTAAIALIRRQLHASETNSLTEQLDLECANQRTAGQGRDFIEGVTAFMEKRPAKFSGR
ncbi:MAG: 2-(1,2-epoxy-1,2-dihydrophenyl)acetyl-CoA isomerase [Sphingomonadales bacterium]|nr:2-(1,2-epoxy-1,2-dihydrophenyl)acetyl-CoA isomerase [Sphingomonadales bacterium]